MNNNIFEWQMSAWRSLCARQFRLPHALLISGPSGLGKSYLAERFAQLLLCQSPVADEPCGTCASCGWLALGNHPDFRRVQPESMEPEPEDQPPRREKKKSDQIRIEQIRDLEGFLSVGTHRGGFRVVIIDPADAMNFIAQNALLKALEEPSASTLFLLVSSRPQSLVPTIRSRCQNLSVARPSKDEALRWLREQGVDQPEAALAAAAGAPLAAAEAAPLERSKSVLIGQLTKPSFDIIGLAQACEAFDPALVIAWLQRWTYDLLHIQATGTVRYHPGLEGDLENIGRGVSAEKLAGYFRHLAQARALARHPLNPKLFFEGLFLEYLTALKPASAK